MTTQAWSIEPNDQVVSLFRHQFAKGERTFECLLLSDTHTDSKHHLGARQKKLLDAALARNAPVFKFGDTFDVMQGSHDKRAMKGSTKKEHDEPDYIDRLVQTAADIYQPYASVLAYIGMGNHETHVLKHAGVNLTIGLCRELKHRTGLAPIPGGYRGWIKFLFTLANNARQSKNLYWSHGAGGGGAMTFGTLNVKRRAAYVPDADIVVGGHIHEDWSLRIGRFRLTAQGREVSDEQLHISIPSLKDPQTGKALGWEQEKEMAPKVTGAYWLRFTAAKEDNSMRVFVNAVRALPEEL